MRHIVSFSDQQGEQSFQADGFDEVMVEVFRAGLTGVRVGAVSGNSDDDDVFQVRVTAKQLGHLSPHLPAYVMIPRMVPGAGPAYLGVSCKPFETQADPARDGPFKVPNFAMPEGVTVERVGDRRNLLTSFDTLRRDVDHRRVRPVCCNGGLAMLPSFPERHVERLKVLRMLTAPSDLCLGALRATLHLLAHGRPGVVGDPSYLGARVRKC